LKKYRSFVDKIIAKGLSCQPKWVISIAIVLEMDENIAKKLMLETAI
jgi:hypothetical protein